jgi:CDP-diacylglycerol--serine O-phosphatidyltransferase
MKSPRPPRSGIYLLPTLFTVGNLFFGFSSLVQTFRGSVELGAVLIIVAGVLDGLDGRIARLTGTSSDFGNEFDSLADVVSFGVAPALLAYRWALTGLGRVGWLVAFLFVVCAATRLARFNIQAGVGEKRWFAGMPSPAAAGSVAAVAFAFPQTIGRGWLAVTVAVFVTALGLLMVSRVRYRSFKELDLPDRRSYLFVLPLAAMLVAIAVHPKGALLVIALLYVVSGPFAILWSVLRRAAGGTAHRDDRIEEPLVR